MVHQDQQRQDKQVVSAGEEHQCASAESVAEQVDLPMWGLVLDLGAGREMLLPARSLVERRSWMH